MELLRFPTEINKSMWGCSNHVMKPSQNVTTGNSNFTSGFEAAPKIFPLISLNIGELNKRGGLDSIGIEKEHSPVSPLLELRSFRGDKLVPLIRFSNSTQSFVVRNHVVLRLYV